MAHNLTKLYKQTKASSFPLELPSPKSVNLS